MLNEQTADKMMTMKLDAMEEAWRLQQKDPQISVLSFDERMGLLVDAQWTARENHRVKRLRHDAKLRSSGACLEDLDYSARRELDRAVVRQFASCKWTRSSRTSSSPGRLTWGRATWPAHLPTRPAGRASGRTTDAFKGSLERTHTGPCRRHVHSPAGHAGADGRPGSG